MYNQSEISQAVKVLVALGKSDDFNRGVVGLGEMLRVLKKGEWSLVTSDRLIAAASCLLALGIDPQFDRGVTALAVSLLPDYELDTLGKQAKQKRKMLTQQYAGSLPQLPGQASV